MPAWRARETLGETCRVQLGQNQKITDVQHTRRRIEYLVDIRGMEFAVRPQRVNEPAILATDIDDERLTGGPTRIGAQGLYAHAVSDQGLSGETTEDIVTDTCADGDIHSQPGQVNGCIGGSAADVENEPIDRNELSRARHPSDRRRQMIDDHHARTGNRECCGGSDFILGTFWHGHD